MNRSAPPLWKPRFGQILHWARLVFTPLSLLVMGALVWQAREALVDVVSNGAWSLLLLAVLLWMGTNLVSPLATVCIFRACAMEISYRQSLAIHCDRLPAKYLPGGIWHSVGRGSDYLVLGHEPGRIGRYFIVENALLVAVTLGMGAILVQHLAYTGPLRILLRLLFLAAAVALLLLPFYLKHADKSGRRFSPAAYLTALVLLAGYWSLTGLVFAIYISAFPGLELANSMIEVAGIYVFSWSVGYLALFAPQGIGVSEFVAGNLLASGNLAGQLVAFLFSFRMVVLVGDICCWLVLRIFSSKV